MSGVTLTGFDRKLFAEILADVERFQREKISSFLILDETTAIGNVNSIICDELAELWEALENVYKSFDPDDAVGAALEALAALTGVEREPPKKGRVAATVGVGVGFSASAGAMVAHVSGQPENRWISTEDISAPGGGSFDLVFESENAGSQAVALAGNLNVIAQPLSGWVSVTNAADAVPGEDIETIEALRKRREDSLAVQGSATAPGIKSDIAKIEGVDSVSVFENDQNVTVGGLPPHSVRVVVFDGDPPALADETIAAEIYKTKAAGASTFGGISTDVPDVNENGDLITILWDRAVQLEIFVEIDFVGDADAEDVKEAIVSQGNLLDTGEDVIRNKLLCAALLLDGVDDITSFRVGAPALGTSNISVGLDEIARFDTSRITVI